MRFEITPANLTSVQSRPFWQVSSAPPVSRIYSLPDLPPACTLLRTPANQLTPRPQSSDGGARGVLHSPSLNSDKITDNKDFKKWIDSYLGVGEWVMDQSVAVLGSSSYFERKR